MYHIAHKRFVIAVGALVLLISLSALLLLTSRSPASAQGPISKFVGEGDFGSVFWSDGSIFGFVGVSRGGSVQNPQTFLFYFVFQSSPCCTALQEGFGLIPNSDLKGTGTARLSLNTDTSASANLDFIRFAGSGGVVAIDWQRNSDFFSRFTGNSQGHFGNILFISNGTSESSLASAQGSVVGSTLGGTVSASMGKNHQVSIQIQQGPSPAPTPAPTPAPSPYP